WWTDAGEQHQEKLAIANHFVLEIEHFSDCALNQKTPALSLEDANNNCKAIVAAIQSAMTGNKVEIN
ncbi:MAG: gfo/Idh/MocA family oxidoreductase, partial [Gammaproteobacteria bacterium]